MASFSLTGFSISSLSIAAFDFGFIDDFVPGDDWLKYDPYAARVAREMELAKKAKKAKEEEIIRLSLEAQEALILQREFEALNRTKQETKQLEAIKRKYQQINRELVIQYELLQAINRAYEHRKKIICFLLVCAASPFHSLSLN